MKETFYFTHDYNVRSDEKIRKLIRIHGMEGYGVFWSIVEDLYQNANALRLDYDGIAYEIRVDIKVVESIVNDFDLFIIEGDIFGSKSVETRLLERDSKSSKARESARKRWDKNDANALRTQSECNAIKEKKVKEKKDKEIKKEIVDRERDIQVLQEHINTLPDGTTRHTFYSSVLKNIELIQYTIDTKAIEGIEKKLGEFRSKLGDEKTKLELESFWEHHSAEKTDIKSLILRLNTWIGYSLKK